MPDVVMVRTALVLLIAAGSELRGLSLGSLTPEQASLD